MSEVLGYGIDIDLSRASQTLTVPVRTVIRFRAESGSATVDLNANGVREVQLNGRPLDPSQVWQRPLLRLDGVAAVNVLEVAADFPVTEERGYRSWPGGVYSAVYPRSAPSCFCCFDDPALRAPIDLRVWAPDGAICLANAALASKGHGWRFRTTAPIAPYLFAVAVGEWGNRAEVGPVAVYAQSDIGREIAGLAARALADYESLVGRYEYGKLDIALVPGFPSLAFSAPGIVLLRDSVAEALPLVIAHEVGHQWIGGSVDLVRADAWLVEALTTYLSRLLVRRWGELGDASPDAGYLSDASLITELERDIGEEAVLAGVRMFVHRFAGKAASRTDLVACWPRAGSTTINKILFHD